MTLLNQILTPNNLGAVIGMLDIDGMDVDDGLKAFLNDVIDYLTEGTAGADTTYLGSAIVDLIVALLDKNHVIKLEFVDQSSDVPINKETEIPYATDGTFESTQAEVAELLEALDLILSGDILKTLGILGEDMDLKGLADCYEVSVRALEMFDDGAKQ